MQRMNSLRRSLRDSFRKKRDSSVESSKPHQWLADEEAVRSGNCFFHVKYLGCVEVYESRGMQICEEAMKILRASRRRPVKSILYISGDGLRVVEDDTKGLIVDQTIEKVSFCAPDRNHERGFSYICRDGTTRRWMCNGFLASSKDSGERLSHAVGCAFASCLERKQRREKEIGVSMAFDPKNSTFTRSGSFRSSNNESKGQENRQPTSPNNDNASTNKSAQIATSAIERPRAPAKMLERQGSFRGFSALANRSPFKRQLSLRLSELPSNIQRTQQNSIDLLSSNVTIPPLPPPTQIQTNANTILNNNNSYNNSSAIPQPPPILRNQFQQRSRLQSLPTSGVLTGIRESNGSLNGSQDVNINSDINKIENKDLVSELCQQVTHGLSMLSNHDDLKGKVFSQFPTKFSNPWDEDVMNNSSSSSFGNSPLPVLNTVNSVTTTKGNNRIYSTNSSTPINDLSSPSKSTNSSFTPSNSNIMPSSNILPTATKISNQFSPKKEINTVGSNSEKFSPKPTPPPPTYLKNSSNNSSPVRSSTNNNPVTPVGRNNRPPLISSASVATANNQTVMQRPVYRGVPTRSQSLGSDPFDADWANNQTSKPTNPFSRHQTFQISM